MKKVTYAIALVLVLFGVGLGFTTKTQANSSGVGVFVQPEGLPQAGVLSEFRAVLNNSSNISSDAFYYIGVNDVVSSDLAAIEYYSQNAWRYTQFAVVNKLASAFVPFEGIENNQIRFRIYFNRGLPGVVSFWALNPNGQVLLSNSTPITVLPAGSNSYIYFKPEVLGISTGYIFTKDLKFGSTGLEVTELQSRLRAEGFFKLQPTGYFGSVTTAALRAFQRDRGLQETGTLNEGTRVALNYR
jgi:hypothetical protein